MAIPVQIEGKDYFVALPTLPDFRTFREFLAAKRRRELAELIPSGLPDEELRRRLSLVRDECNAIDPFKCWGELVESLDGMALMFHAILRGNQQVTLAWVRGVCERAEAGDMPALEGLRNLRQALQALMEAKKNERAAQLAAAQQGQSTSTPSTSPSPNDMGSELPTSTG